MNRIALLLALASVAVPAASLAASPDASPAERARRWLPESCRPLLDLEEEAEPPRPAEARWNLHYRRGWEAIETRDLETAERSLCQALDAARSLGPGDLRFAETLDEIGLVSYLRGDFAQAEAMQGAAVTEILLALGLAEDMAAADWLADLRRRLREGL